MDFRLQKLLEEVFLETHGEHLADTVAARLVRAAARFHASPTVFQEDVRTWEFEGEGSSEDTVALASLPNLRDVLNVFVRTDRSTGLVKAKETTLTDLLVGCGGVKYTRVGDALKIVADSRIRDIMLVSAHPPTPTMDNFDTWLYPKHTHWLVQLGIAITQDAVGDDSRNLSLQLAREAMQTLIASLPKYSG